MKIKEIIECKSGSLKDQELFIFHKENGPACVGCMEQAGYKEWWIHDEFKKAEHFKNN